MISGVRDMKPGTRNTIEAWLLLLLLLLLKIGVYIGGVIITLYILKIAFRFVFGASFFGITLGA